MLHARATVGVFLLVLQIKCAVLKYFSLANKGVKNVAEDFLRAKSIQKRIMKFALSISRFPWKSCKYFKI